MENDGSKKFQKMVARHFNEKKIAPILSFNDCREFTFGQKLQKFRKIKFESIAKQLFSHIHIFIHFNVLFIIYVSLDKLIKLIFKVI